MASMSCPRDPLVGFEWAKLHETYMKMCKGFDKDSWCLVGFLPQPNSDLELYYELIERFVKESNSPEGLQVDTYIGMLYWKHYSGRRGRAERLCFRVQDPQAHVASALADLSKVLPRSLDRNPTIIGRLVEDLGEYRLPGMTDSSALPTRTTFLHFWYPHTVPIFDSQALKSLGIEEKKASSRIESLRQYLNCVWELSTRYAGTLPAEPRETQVRLIEMALWVERGSKACRDQDN